MTLAHGTRPRTPIARISATIASPFSQRRARSSTDSFLELLRAGQTDYVINAAALDYMRDHNLPKITVSLLTANAERRFADRTAFMAHLGVGRRHRPQGQSRPGADCNRSLAGASIAAQGLIDGTVIVSGGAGQFRAVDHAPCWVHAERRIHQLDAFCEAHRKAKGLIRHRIWWLYADLKAYRQAPAARRAGRTQTPVRSHLFNHDRLCHALLAACAAARSEKRPAGGPGTPNLRCTPTAPKTISVVR